VWVAHCFFDIKNNEDNSKIGVNGNEVYCVAQNCIGYGTGKKAKIIQFDDSQNKMVLCELGAIIENGIPVDKHRSALELKKIKGVRC